MRSPPISLEASGPPLLLLKTTLPVTCQIIFVDDHALIRDSLSQLTEFEEGINCIGTCGDTVEANRLLTNHRVDVAIFDLQLGTENSLQFVSEKSREVQTKFLISTAHRSDVYAPLCQSAGASGFIHKTHSPIELFGAVHQLADPAYDGRFIGPKLELPTQAIPSLESLSKREWDVLQMIAQGVGTKQIAEKLFLSVKTVESHRVSLKKKLGIQSKDFLAVIAMNLCGAAR